MNRLITLPVRFAFRSDRHRYRIDKRGNPAPTRGVASATMDVSTLMRMLMSVGVVREEERSDLAAFLNAAGYVPPRKGEWREGDLTDAVLERWRVFRDITVRMATSNNALEWGSKILDEFPDDVVERAMWIVLRGVPGTIQLKIGPTFDDGGYRPEYISELVTRDPLDVIWVNLQIDKMAGIGYEKCKSTSCREFFQLPFNPKLRKRKKEFHSEKCKWRDQKARQQKDEQQKWLRIVHRVSRQLPLSEQTSTKIWERVKAKRPDFPHAKNWITYNLLKKGQTDGQKQRG